MKTPFFRLDEVAGVVSGSTPSTTIKEYYGGDILWATPKDLSGLDDIYLSETKKRITEAGYKSCSTTLLPAGSVLFSSRAPIGLIAIAKHEICTNQGFKNFVCDRKKLLPEYLYYCLRFYRPMIQGLGRGATFTEISKELISCFKIPVPPIEKQKEVAELLIKTEQLIKKRRETLRLADDFLKSAFLEMFGDPATNPKKWPIKDFRESFSSIIYGTGSPPAYQDSGIPFVRATNIKGGTVLSKDMKFISVEEAKKIEKCKLAFGNLILFRSGVNAGDCGLIPQPFDGAYAAYDLILKLPYPSAVFFNHLINSDFGKTMLAPLKRRAGQPHLNAEQISSLKFITPPIEDKQKFAVLVQKIEKYKEKLKQSETHLQSLFNSLMQRAFRGELF